MGLGRGAKVKLGRSLRQLCPMLLGTYFTHQDPLEMSVTLSRRGQNIYPVRQWPLLPGRRRHHHRSFIGVKASFEDMPLKRLEVLSHRYRKPVTSE